MKAALFIEPLGEIRTVYESWMAQGQSDHHVPPLTLEFVASEEQAWQQYELNPARYQAVIADYSSHPIYHSSGHSSDHSDQNTPISFFQRWQDAPLRRFALTRTTDKAAEREAQKYQGYTAVRPITERELEELMKEVYGGRILLVDDEDALRRSMVRILSKVEGVAGIDEAADGQQAVDMFTAHPARYGLVLTDYRMPVKDGLAFLKEISDYRIPPRVMLSSGLDQEESERLLTYRASGMILKPFRDFKFIQTIVHELISQGRSPMLEEYMQGEHIFS